MLVELAVRDLGVIEDARLVIGPGMTALTGETGAGKTLVVDAIELLVGARADAVLVRAGATEAWVEGRFVVPDADDDEDDEVVLARAIPPDGRSRAYVNGKLATATELAAWGERLVDLHGQHAHQSLLGAAVQRAALDQYAGIDLAPLRAARAEEREIVDRLEALGGDERSRAREIDLLRFQVAELTDAAITGADEDAALAAEETLLADANEHRDAAGAAGESLTGDDGAADAVGAAITALAGRGPFEAIEARLRAVAAEVADLATEVRSLGEGIAEDPERLDVLRRRRQLLVDLRRKYGDTLADVLAHGRDAAARLAELEQHDQRAAELDREREAVRGRIGALAASVAAAREKAAPAMAAEVEANLQGLAMPRARVEVLVAGEPPADDVAVLLAANPGSNPAPLTKVASGGELARAMLALRLVLTAGPPTLVFDEVDAGIGGEAAVAVGRSLAALTPGHQVLVVTHLPQVAAFADAHVRVSKVSDEDATVSHLEELDGQARVVELSRMLSGQPDSRTARDHAEELLATAAGLRGGR